MNRVDDYRDAAALPFYSSQAWKNCRAAYKKSVANLCERCYSRGIITRGEIVHHIKPLNAGNINDPAFTLSFDNLELLCRKCHGEIHAGKRFAVDENGRITAIDAPLYRPHRDGESSGGV